MLHERIEINQWLVAILLVRLVSGSLVALGSKITDSQHWNESRNPHVFIDVIISTSEVIIQPLDVKFYQVVVETGVGQPCFILPDAPKACSFCWSKQKPLCWWFNYRDLGVAFNPCETFRQTGHLPRSFWRKSSLNFSVWKTGFKKNEGIHNKLTDFSKDQDQYISVICSQPWFWGARQPQFRTQDSQPRCTHYPHSWPFEITQLEKVGNLDQGILLKSLY